MERASKKVGQIAESVTLAVDAKAKKLKAEGQPIIGFGAGEPDFATPQHIVDAAIAAASELANHKYTPVPGLPELREAVVQKTKRDSGLTVESSQVIITNGGKHAIFNTCMTLLNEGDEVLLPAPYWTTYPEAVKVSGGVPVEIATDEASGYRVSVDQLEKARTPRTKMLIFVSPSNPTGGVYTREQIIEIGKWAKENGVWVMCDEIYEHLVYGDAKHFSMPVLVPELAEQCVVVNGVAKTYAMTGWRVGWMIGPKDIIAAATNLQSHATSNVSNVAQRAALAALNGPLDCVVEMREAFDRRRQLIVKMLNEVPGFSCPEPDGAFYAFPSVKGTLGRPIGKSRRSASSSLELAELLLEEAKVAVVPGEAFGAPGYFRFSYATSDDAIRSGITRIDEVLSGREPDLST
jgi:aspartate aminotransferase